MSNEELRELIAGATKGQWGFALLEQCSPSTNHEPLAYWVAGWGPATYGYNKSIFIKHHDAKFIQAFNPQKATELLDKIDQLQAENTALKAQQQ